ncbi:hypothetical protein DO72_4897 [Burkholderia pseudomallei]|nr:hypothetical protein DO72_4897 [Burkholderia pseudomallei]
MPSTISGQRRADGLHPTTTRLPPRLRPDSDSDPIPTRFRPDSGSITARFRFNASSIPA